MKILPTIVRFSVLTGICLFVAGCGERSVKPSPSTPPLEPVSVRVAPARQIPYLVTEEIAGTVRAKTRATLEAKVNGRIVAFQIVEGQTVEAGQALVRLDVQEIRARLEQAQAQNELAARDLERLEVLLEREAVTRQEYDTGQSRARVARAALDEAQTMLGYAEITAPFDGVVVRKLADVGDQAVPGKPLLEMEDPATPRLEANVPEALLGGIRAGHVMPVHLPSLGARMEGTVAEMAAAGDAVTRTFLVKWDLPFQEGVRSGMFGRVAIPVREQNVLRVPASAVVTRGQMEMVFVADNARSQMRLVKTGRTMGNELEILSGLHAGELVVIDGASSLQDGQPLEIGP